MLRFFKVKSGSRWGGRLLWEPRPSVPALVSKAICSNSSCRSFFNWSRIGNETLWNFFLLKRQHCLKLFFFQFLYSIAPVDSQLLAKLANIRSMNVERKRARDFCKVWNKICLVQVSNEAERSVLLLLSTLTHWRISSKYARNGSLVPHPCGESTRLTCDSGLIPAAAM